MKPLFSMYMQKLLRVTKKGKTEVRVRGTKDGKKQVTLMFVVACTTAGQMLKPMV
jgi:hypothetical protein